MVGVLRCKQPYKSCEMIQKYLVLVIKHSSVGHADILFVICIESVENLASLKLLCGLYIFLFSSQVSVREEGVRSLAKGWAPTCIGYSMQGICKFGFYEVFKILYSNLLGEENTYLYRTSLYLAASASAEFFADIALSPMEAVKVREDF